ncbi:ATP-dependent RNA helicase DbpA [Enterobacterales bacterium CwR94]|nr:ATP-dependent RNA helicase DbpA [Enterobacterales bacterium CwR94]
MSAFSTLNALSESQLSNLSSLGYLQMTPVQAAALPVVLAGRDVRAQAQTGSGKTAAFGIGLIHRLDSALYKTQSLVLCPTRELADQVAQELRRLARATANVKILTLCGGQPMNAQRDSLNSHAPHIVVGTPGRILDHLKRGSLSLDALQTIVLDEADRMLDMGFRDDLDAILQDLPVNRQTLLFSATWPQDIVRLSTRYQREPEAIEMGGTAELPDIEQTFYEVNGHEKIRALAGLLSQQLPAACVVFCNMKRECDDVVQALNGQGIDALSLHGDLEQRDRDQVMIRFANGSCRVLVATDVAARGLDIKDLPLVVNLALAWDPEVHVHRIGRTARAGQKGVAVSFVAADEMVRAHAVEAFLAKKLQWQSTASLLRATVLPLEALHVTLCIDGGRKAKIRPGDVLGALTSEGGISGEQVGKISLTQTHAYVAVKPDIARQAMKQLQQGKIKGKTCRARLLK